MTSSEPAQAAPTLLLSDYLRLIRRRRYVLIAGVLLGALLGWTFSEVRGPTYEATSSVLVRPVAINPNSITTRPDQLVNLPTERQLIRSAAISSRAAELMATSLSTDALLNRLTIVIPDGTQILDITFSARTPEAAQSGAQAFATAYLESREKEAVALVEQRRERVTSEVGRIEESLIEANERLVSSDEGSLTHALALADIDLLNSRMRDLQLALAEIDQLGVDPGEVIAPATVPTEPSSQPSWLLILLGGIATGVLSLPVAFAVERLDDRIWDEVDLRDFGSHVLGSVIVPPPGPDGLSPALTNSTGTHTEAYRRLSLSVMSALAEHGGERLGVVSGTSAPGDPEVMVELAATTARMGYHVLLLNADSENGSIASALPVAGARGLGDILVDGLTIADVIHIVEELPQLRVILEGRRWDDTVAWEEFSGLVKKLPGSSDVLMVNTAAALESAHSLRVSGLMDAVVLMARRGSTTLKDLHRARRELGGSGAQLLGIIFVANGGMSRARRRRGA